MKINKLTNEQIRSLDFKAMQWNELKSDDYRVLRTLIAELQEYRKELPGGLFELQNIKSDSRSLSKKLGDALERNSRQAIELQEYRKAAGEPVGKVYRICNTQRGEHRFEDDPVMAQLAAVNGYEVLVYTASAVMPVMLQARENRKAPGGDNDTER